MEHTRDGWRKEARRPNVLLLSSAILVLAVMAMACHKSDWHLGSIHPSAGPEDWCISDESSERPTVSEAHDWIQQALWDNGTDGDWNGVSGINQIYHGTNCGGPASDIDLVYHLVEVPLPGCGNACARRSVGEFEGPSHEGFTDYDFYDIYLSSQVMIGVQARYRRHVINHETGHAYGLDDPVSNWKTDSYIDCYMDAYNRNVLVPSIMHNDADGLAGFDGYCQGAHNFEFPTDYDRTVVEMIAEFHSEAPNLE